MSYRGRNRNNDDFMEVIWTTTALQGLERARRYIAEDNPEAAKRVYEAILAGAGRLGDMWPEMGRPGRVDGTREWVVSKTPYLIAYAIAASQVKIIAVQHGAQKWPERF